MKRIKNTQGFTLLEIIIVILIIGVLASIALPRLFSSIQVSYGHEAMESLMTLARAVDNCGNMGADPTAASPAPVFTGCTMGAIPADDPGAAANAHFTYAIAAAATEYTITATRDGSDGGDTTSVIELNYDAATGTTRSGTGVFASIK